METKLCLKAGAGHQPAVLPAVYTRLHLPTGNKHFTSKRKRLSQLVMVRETNGQRQQLPRRLSENKLTSPTGRTQNLLKHGKSIKARARAGRSAFEQRPDKLCVFRQLAELMRLPLQEMLSDFDTICKKNVAGARHHPPRDPGILPLAPSPDVLRGLPGRLLDKYEPTVKEQRVVTFTSWNGHAFSTNPPAPSS